MPFVIRQAKSATDLNDVMQLRYQVLLESNPTDQGRHSHSKMVVDHYDVLPNTINVIGYKDGIAVAALRALEYDTKSRHLNFPFDFNEASTSLQGRFFQIDAIAILKSASGHPLVLSGLIRNLVSVLVGRKISHLFLTIPEEYLPKIDDIGFRKLSDAVVIENSGSRQLPLVLDVNIFYDKVLAGIRDREIMRFQEAFYRIIYDPGETLVTEGEQGNTAFIVESGEVDVLRKNDGKLVKISSISGGSLIGEIGLVTKEPRTATIVAKTSCSCIAFDRESFLHVLYQYPNRMLDLFQIISRRLNSTTKELARLQAKVGA